MEDKERETSKERPKPYPADYKGATPRQVAEALLRHRPAKEAKKPAKKAKPVTT